MPGFTSTLPAKMAIYVTSSLVTTFTFTLNGAHANVVLSGRQFLIQSNWLNSGGGSCAMGFNSQTPAGLTFVPVTPCRVADTRNPAGAFGGPFIWPLKPHVNSIFPTALATYPPPRRLTQSMRLSFRTVFLGSLPHFPADSRVPLASTLNAMDGRVKAAAAIRARRNKWWFVFLFHQ